MSEEAFSGLIEGFYAAAAGEIAWPDVAAAIARFFDTHSTAILLRAPDTQSPFFIETTPNFAPDLARSYVAHYSRLDPWAKAWQALGKSGIYTNADLINVDEFRRSEFYTDYCVRVDNFHFLGAGVVLDSETQLLLGIHRGTDRDDFGATERRQLARVAPHLARALQMRQALATADLHRRLSLEMLRALAVAVVVVDGACRIRFVNTVADRLLIAGDALLARGGRLTTRDPRQGQVLCQAVAHAARATTGDPASPAKALLLSRPGKSPLSVLAAPLAASVWPAAGMAALFITDPQARQSPNSASIVARFSLTPAEARLLEALLTGERLSDYAAMHGVTANTVKTHLKQLFAKTGTNRQADLIRLVMSDPVSMLAQAEQT